MWTQSSKRSRLIGYFFIERSVEEQKHTHFIDVLEALLPAVEEVAGGEAFADVKGLDGIYASPEMLARDVMQQVASRLGFEGPVPLKIGIAANKFVARLAAFAGGRNGFAYVGPEEAETFLASMPVDCLPVDDNVKQRLDFFGLTRLQDVAQMGPAALVDQFGTMGRTMWELCSGIDDTPLNPGRLFHPIGERLTFPSPVWEWPALWAGVRQLLTKLWQHPRREGKTVRRLCLLAEGEGEQWENHMTLHEPVGDLERLQAMLHRRLEGGRALMHAAPFKEMTGLTVQITELGPSYVAQEGLFPGVGGRMKQIAQAFAGIRARDGHSGLYRVAEVQEWSRIPERRYALISFDV